jgi:hypothetical protein
MVGLGGWNSKEKISRCRDWPVWRLKSSAGNPNLHTRRTSSSAVEQPVYTRLVGGSIPSSCIYNARHFSNTGIFGLP